MNLSDRVLYLESIFDDLMSTSSRNDKQDIVNCIISDCKQDFDFCIECLNGKKPFGYKYEPEYIISKKCEPLPETYTVTDLLKYMLEPKESGDLSKSNIRYHVDRTLKWWEFLEGIINKKYKLGIGNSLLKRDGLEAMLAKKYEGDVSFDKCGYFITEKLDGNRCIAHYENGKWVFTSRNGKNMYVNFDMEDLPTDYVYDGEVLSPSQVELSKNIFEKINNDVIYDSKIKNQFNSTSGLINKHELNKDLIYNIFDIQLSSATYKERRDILKSINVKSKNVRILPVLYYVETKNELVNCASKLLIDVTSSGGEGIMINLGNRLYEHKRTDGLLKYKDVKTMDLRVMDVQYGTGKYECEIGALMCYSERDGLKISCKVGSGLSDEQRLDWSIHKEKIVGKIVEVEYFEISQEKDLIGTNLYSLRFPRLKKVRRDKSDTSEY